MFYKKKTMLKIILELFFISFYLACMQTEIICEKKKHGDISCNYICIFIYKKFFIR